MVYITVLDKNNSPTGPFTQFQVQAKMNSGEFSPEDLAFIPGMKNWTPLKEVMASVSAGGGKSTITYDKPVSKFPDSYGEYAGFWLRFFAYLIDSFFISAVVLFLFENSATGSVNHPVTPASLLDAQGHWKPEVKTRFAYQIFVLLIPWLYCALLESSPMQATVGKALVGIFVTDLNGGRIGFGRATLRHFWKILSALTCFIGYLMAGFTQRKQALHDMLARTLVVRK